MKALKRILIVLLCVGASACNVEDPTASSGPVFAVESISTPQSVRPDTSVTDPANPRITYSTDALLFNGTGVSVSDWQNTETILKEMGLSYQLANTAQLNAMSLEQLAGFGLIIVPGGSGGTIYSGLATEARLRIRQAVRDHGVGYVGFCAGAWVAVGPEAATDSTASYGFAVAKGAILPYWYPAGNSSLVADMVDVTFADGSKRSLVWWGGPATPEWSGGVIARYADAKPAISQTFSGKGLVVISGPHPEAPESWRLTAGADSDGLDYDIAEEMIRAALHKTPME